MTQDINIPASLSAIGGQLPDYRPPDGIISADTNCSLYYEIFQWDKTHPDGLTDNTQIGTVEISRSGEGNEFNYQILEKRLGGEEEVYKAEVTTARTGELGESIMRWSLDWHHQNRPNDHLELSGLVQDKVVEIDGTLGQKQVSVDLPVLCPWLMPFVISIHGLSSTSTTRFTTADELTYLKPSQLLNGPIQIQVNGQNFQEFRHTGPATLPIHYVFDTQGRPVFVTFTMVSWILRRSCMST